MSPRPELAGFMDRFPVAGVSGTLAPSYRRYTSWPTACAAGKVKAKTGSLSGVYALSGVAVARDGRPRVFSFVANGVPATSSGRAVRAALDRLAATVVGCY
jgi:D-alanyl-D-alanine carboxypeptidase/D-alanyl-D-alanine-endopeptidase (penicillin-binding protein 4)